MAELDVKEIADHLSQLVTETDEDEAAKRFDLSCYNMQLDLLLKGAVNSNQVGDVKTIAGKLTKKASISAVAAKLLMLQEIQKKPFWDGVTIPRIESLRQDKCGIS